MIHCHYTLAQLQSCLDDWDVEIIQLGPTRIAGDARSIALPSVRVVRLQAGKPIVIRGTASAIHDCLILSSPLSAPVRWLGQPIDARRFAVTGRGARIDLFLPADATVCIIGAGLLTGVTARRVQMRSGSIEGVSRLLSFAEAAGTDADSSPQSSAHDIDEALIREVRVALETSEALVSEASARSLRAWAVARACRYIDSRLQKPMSLADLSRHCGVGIRTLEYSFRQFYDTTPIGFIKSQRLTRTHVRLAQPGAAATSISKIAKRTGFTHMGQFCQDYRALFGESPSMTLQRALNLGPAVARPTSARPSP